jgi:hypothetical protein
MHIFIVPVRLAMFMFSLIVYNGYSNMFET